MEVVLVLVSLAFLVTLGMLLFGKKTAGAAPAIATTSDDSKVRQLVADLEKRKKELEEQKKQLVETKDELKQAKKKLYEQKEGDKGLNDLAKARLEVERSASTQLEIVRVELANALTELDRLRGDKGGPRRVGVVSAPSSTSAPVPAAPISVQAIPVATAPAAAPAETEKPKRVIRELNDADREKMERLERDAKKARDTAAQAERELRRLKGKLETDKRVFVVTRGELDLIKDKYKAIEKRMNRTLLANDLLKRAIRDLEKKTGITAERSDPTAEELASSDTQTEERVTAEAAKDAERHAQNVAAAEEAGRKAAESLEANANSTQPASDQTTPSEVATNPPASH